MKIYLAANWNRREDMVRKKEKVEAAGHTVTSRWIDQTFDTDVANAWADMKDLMDAEALFLFNDVGGEYDGSGGKYVELGIALSCGMPIICIGKKERNIFLSIPTIQHVSNLKQALSLIVPIGDVEGVEVV